MREDGVKNVALEPKCVGWILAPVLRCAASVSRSAGREGALLLSGPPQVGEVLTAEPC